MNAANLRDDIEDDMAIVNARSVLLAAAKSLMYLVGEPDFSGIEQVIATLREFAAKEALSPETRKRILLERSQAGKAVALP